MNRLAFALLTVVIVVSMTDSALATPLQKLNPFAEDAMAGTEKVAYALGGFAAISVGVMAFFGRFSWGGLFALIGGLALVAGASLIVTAVGGTL
jgi:hypothetical protein